MKTNNKHISTQERQEKKEYANPQTFVIQQSLSELNNCVAFFQS